MSSRKVKPHKNTPNAARQNGKASKKHPKKFSAEKRKLIPA